MKNVKLDEDHAPDVILMAWVKTQIHRYVIPLYNFKSCWVDGKIFCAILLNNGLLEKKHSWEKLCDLSAEQRIELGTGCVNRIPSIFSCKTRLFFTNLYFSYTQPFKKPLKWPRTA
jgi:hypothetical protein